MSELVLPKINKETISKKDYIFKSLAKIINPENVLSHADEIKPYETDALAAYTQTPLAVVMPENTQEVSDILKFCHAEDIKVVPDRTRKTHNVTSTWSRTNCLAGTALYTQTLSTR